MKILLAIDGSNYTDRMLPYLLAHKEWTNAGHAFTVFHAVAPVPTGPPLSPSPTWCTGDTRAWRHGEPRARLGRHQGAGQLHGAGAACAE